MLSVCSHSREYEPVLQLPEEGLTCWFFCALLFSFWAPDPANLPVGLRLDRLLFHRHSAFSSSAAAMRVATWSAAATSAESGTCA
jgi:hypothetical protein